MPYTQDNRLIAIETPLGKDVLLLSSFQGSEGLSIPFCFELELLSENHNIQFKDIIGQYVTVSILLADGKKRYFHGLISRFSQGRGTEKTGTGAVLSSYTATMVPWFWLLTRTADSRIFQNLTVPEIVQQIFQEKGFLDFENKLHSSYDQWIYCVQYRETDFNFICRLLEEEGIYFFFKHEDKKHTLVLSDVPDEHKDCPGQETARYQITAGGWLEEDTISILEMTQEIKAGKYALKDFNFETPNTDLKVEAASKQALGPGEREIYDYPAGYGKRARGDNLVNIRMQEEEAEITTITGSSDCRAFTSGYRFELKDYHRQDMNDKAYVLTSLSHWVTQGYTTEDGESEFSYNNEFTCIPLDVPYRPPRNTPKPVVEGVQTAIVAGPSGEEIYPDEHGRVKVQFHWDREGKKDDHSSCWIRVSQLWAGAGWGAMYIPRIGHEVIVDFVEGDPDCPIIIGRVYHGANKPPYGLPGAKTQSTIMSNSSKGGGGSNELRFEDAAGSEEVYIHAQKDTTIATENDKNQTTGHDETLSIGNNRTKTVGVDQSETVGSNKEIKVGSNHTEAIGANMSQNVGSSKTETIAIAKALTIGAAYQVSVGAAMNETIGALKAEEIGAAKMVNVGASSSENVGINKSTDAGSNISESAGKDISEKAGKNISGNAGDNISQSAGKDYSMSSGKKMSLSAGDDYSVAGKKKGVINIADQLTLKCGSSSITMKKDGTITIEGKDINVKGSGDIAMKAKKILQN